MPRRTALTVDDEAAIWEAWLRSTPLWQIARAVGRDRHTVARAIDRIRAELTQTRLADLEARRTEALAEYDAIKRRAWTRLQQCAPTSTASVGYLSALIEARKRQDQLLGLNHVETSNVNVYLAQLHAVLHEPVPQPVIEADGGRWAGHARHQPPLFARRLLGFEPHPRQEAFLECRAPTKVAAAGRRLSKSTAAAAELVWFAVAHPSIVQAVIAPTADQAGLIFGAALRFLEEGPLRPAIKAVTRSPFTELVLLGPDGQGGQAESVIMVCSAGHEGK